VGCLRLRLGAQIPDFAPPVLQQVPVLASSSSPAMQIQRGSFLVGSHAFCPSDEDSLTPMRTPLPAEFAGSE
jgi:hypothetical protein